jgi:hypothetical protein
VEVSNVEICKYCNKAVSGESVITLGKAAHRSCHEAANPISTKRKRLPLSEATASSFLCTGVEVSNVELCPQCSKAVSGDSVINAGKGWHRSCYNIAFPEKGPQVRKQAEEVCGTCKKAIAGEETTIVAGNTHHRRCYVVDFD